MTDLLLTREEIRRITGKVKHSVQTRWLRDMGLLVRQAPNGEPLVSRRHFEQHMGVDFAAGEGDRDVTMNLDALKKTGS